MIEAAHEHSLVGRRRQLDRFHRWIDEVTVGRGAAVLVEGEPGIGKTSLVRAATVRADAVGCRVLWGAGDELSQAFPLLPLLEAVGTGPHDTAAQLAAIMRPLQDDTPPDARTDQIAAAVERILALVDEVCEATPTILVIDDLQWTDTATVMTWRRLARSVRQLPLLLVGVNRPIPHRADLVALRRCVEPAFRLRLTALPEPDVVELVSRAVSGIPGPRLLGLARGAGGSPLYLTELLDALARAGTVVTAGGHVEVTTATPPASLAAAIADRLAFLSPAARSLLRSAALLGVEFPADDLAAVSGLRINDLLPLLDEAVAAGVLRDGGSGLAFRHPMIQNALYQEMLPSVRVAWHRDAAQALARAGAPPERVARQLLPVFDGAEAERDVAGVVADGWLLDWLPDTAHRLVGQAPRAAIPLLRAAVAAVPANEARRDLLACRLADALYRVGDAKAAAAVASAALDHVTRPDLIVDLHWTLAQCRAMAGRSEESLVALDRALATPGVRPGHRARLLVLTARAHRGLGHLDSAGRLATAALDEAATAGDRWATGWALGVLTIVHGMRGELHTALSLAQRALAATDGDPALADLRLLAQLSHATVLGDLDRNDAAVDAAREVCRLADAAGNAVRLAQAQSVLGELLFDTGRWDDALAEIDLADAVPGQGTDPVVACNDHAIAATIRLHRNDADGHGNLAAAAPFAARLGHRVIGSLTLARGLALEQTGSPRAALDTLLEGVSETVEEIGDVADVLADAVRLAVAVGDGTTASALGAYAQTLAQASEAPHRATVALHCRGLLDGDADVLMAAAARYGVAGRVLPRAQAVEAAAIVLAESGETAQARTRFTEAFADYAALGADWDLARMQAQLRGYGIRRGPRAQHRRATHGWDSLTPTELKIAALVAAGLSNPQIAEQLFLSRRTVQSHVSHILSKLAVRSRADIARETAHRQSA